MCAHCDDVPQGSVWNIDTIAFEYVLFCILRRFCDFIDTIFNVGVKIYNCLKMKWEYAR